MRRDSSIDLRPHPSKASTRLAELISPHVDTSETKESYEALVALGALAWNIAVLPKSKQAELIRKAVDDASSAGVPLTVEWMSSLVNRKVDLFPSDDRFIENFGKSSPWPVWRRVA